MRTTREFIRIIRMRIERKDVGYTDTGILKLNLAD